VRNPWDKTVSDYYWRIQRLRTAPSFTSYVEALAAGDDLGGIVPLAFHDNWPMYTINDQVVADRVVRFEQLQEGLEAFFATLASTGMAGCPAPRAAIVRPVPPGDTGTTTPLS